MSKLSGPPAPELSPTSWKQCDMTTDHTDIVPFGKYKGRPVVDLISDRSYTDWLAAQPWFRQRYGNVYNLVLNTGPVPQDSPEHNALQARFLDHDEAIRLGSRWLKDKDELLATWTDEFGSALTDRQRANLLVPDVHTSLITSLQFESHGWDLLIRAETFVKATEVDPLHECICACDRQRCAHPYDRSPEDAPVHKWSSHFHAYTGVRNKHCAGRDCPATWTNQFGYDHLLRGGTSMRLAMAVELKPTLGDDYPSVLREVLKRREMTYARGGRFDSCVVLADEVTFSSVSYEKVRKIFRSQAVHLMTSAELPTLGPAWQCACAECVDG